MSQLAPPFPAIADALLKGKMIPFLGGGASIAGRPSGEPWVKGQCIPATEELVEHLTEYSSYPEDERRDLAKVAQYCELVIGRHLFDQHLHTVFECDPSWNMLHEFLADTSTNILIVTTNYDDLLEQAFKAKDKPFDLVVHPTAPEYAGLVLWWPNGADEPQLVSPNELDISLGETTVIYKMHGTIDRHDPKRDSYVITEDDYVEFVIRVASKTAVPAVFAERFQTSPFLFLGHGLADWNLRVVLRRLEKQWPRWRGAVVSSAIQLDPSLIERQLWLKRDVRICEMDIREFVERLREYS